MLTRIRVWSNRHKKAEPWLLTLLIIIVAGIIIFFRLGATSLNGNDEAIYGQVAKQILHTHNWVTMSWFTDDYKWFDKPPLYMWITAILFKVFGATAFWARFASASAALGVAVVTFLIGRNLFGRSVGLLAALLLTLNVYFLTYARSGMLDTLLTLCMYAALYAFLRSRENPRWWLLAGLFLGLGVMTKGAAAVTIALTLGAVILLTGRARASLASRQFWYGVGVALVVVLPWHLLVWHANGKVFINTYWGYNVLQRGSRAIEGHTGTQGYYLGVLQGGFQPWPLFIPFAIAYALQQFYRAKSEFLVPLIAALIPFLFFSLAVQTKLDWYVLPMLPGLAILIAAFLVSALRDRSSLAVGATVWGVAYLALTMPPHHILRLTLLGLVVGWGAYCLYRKRLAIGPLMAVSLLFFCLFSLALIRPLYGKGQTAVAEIGEYASGHNSLSSPLIVYGTLTDSAASVRLRFYVDRPMGEYGAPDTPQYLLSKQKNANIIIDDKLVDSLNGYQIQVQAKRGSYDYGTIMKTN